MMNPVFSFAIWYQQYQLRANECLLTLDFVEHETGPLAFSLYAKLSHLALVSTSVIYAHESCSSHLLILSRKNDLKKKNENE